MSKYGISTFFGLILGITFIVSSIAVSGHQEYFWNLPSFFITIGGTTASIIIAFPPKKLKTFFPVFRRAFLKDIINLEQDIETLVLLSKEVRSKGVMSLDNLAPQYVDDKFLHTGIQMIADGVSVEDMRGHMQGIIYFSRQRHSKGAAMMDMVASTAPSLGLLGTYVGLIPMLHSLDDPTTLGPMMALELVSSFYGAFIAYVIFSPMAKRLKTMSKEESSRNELILEGLIGIVEGKNPQFLRAELLAFANTKNLDETKKKKRGKSKESVSV